MCKKRFFQHIVLLLLAANAPFMAISQTTLTFSGHDNLDNWVQLHHVTITNLTRNWSNTIYYPDTSYTMFGVGIAEQTSRSSQLAVSQNVPNPFYGTTSVTVSLPSSNTVLMDILDLNGRVIANTRRKLSPGAHIFHIDLQKPQTYILKVSAGQDKAVIKMMNMGGTSTNNIRYGGEGITTSINPKSSTDCLDYPFESGDRMIYIGYIMDDSLYISSDTIEQIQAGDEFIRLLFPLWIPSWEPRHYVDTTPLFIPDGIECNNSCFAVKTIHINEYEPGEIVNDVNDIRYVRLKMEHSYIGDLYIRLTCPNGQYATILRKRGQQSTSGCLSQILAGDFVWQDASALGSASFGWYNKTDVSSYCDPALNPQGEGWNYCWHNEKKAEANEAIYKAQSWFERDSFQLALDGREGEFAGFEEVAEEYSSTPAGNLACAYAGICYKNLGKNDEAIKYLKKFSADDNLVSPAIYGAIGDCFFESNNTKEAESYYKKAINSKNNMIAPLYTYRLAMLYFNDGKNDKAASLMESLKEDYPQSNEARDADKYIQYFQSLNK